jgi:hypothetical protein
VYGTQAVGKSQIMQSEVLREIAEVEVIDCVMMGQLVSQSLDTVDTALEYLELRYAECVARLPSDKEQVKVLLVLDNIQGICPRTEEQAPLIDTVKSERICKWVLQKIESE